MKISCIILLQNIQLDFTKVHLHVEQYKGRFNILSHAYALLRFQQVSAYMKYCHANPQHSCLHAAKVINRTMYSGMNHKNVHYRLACMRAFAKSYADIMILVSQQIQTQCPYSIKAYNEFHNVSFQTH